MPLFVWAIYATSIIQILATPVLGMTLLLVALEHAFGWGIFDPARGGDPVLFQHFFWFYSHPAVYIMVLPAMAVISRGGLRLRPQEHLRLQGGGLLLAGHRLRGLLHLGAPPLHLRSVHLRRRASSACSPCSWGIFTAIKVFNWTATLYKGPITFKTPFAYFVGFLFFLVFGGHDRHRPRHRVAGRPLAGHLLRGGPLPLHHGGRRDHGLPGGPPLLVAQDYRPHVPGAAGGWWPRCMVILGFNFTFIPQFLLGNMGMPRRYFSYPERFQALNVASTAGRQRPGLRARHRPRLLLVALRYGQGGGPEPLALARLRVEHALAAATRELPGDAGHRPRAARVPRPGRRR